MKRKPVCSHCGSDEVRVDAYAEWDVDSQDWVLLATYDDAVCEDCAGECSLDWLEVEDGD